MLKIAAEREDELLQEVILIDIYLTYFFRFLAIRVYRMFQTYALLVVTKLLVADYTSSPCSLRISSIRSLPLLFSIYFLVRQDTYYHPLGEFSVCLMYYNKI